MDSGDVDVAVFDDFTNVDASRCGLSANNGAVDETVALPGSCPVPSGRLQVEIRAVVNSRFTISVDPASAAEVAAIIASNATQGDG